MNANTNIIANTTINRLNKKIEGLTIYLEYLQDDSNEHNWDYYQTCNVGSLLNAIALYGKDSIELGDARAKVYHFTNNLLGDFPEEVEFESYNYTGIINGSKPFISNLNWCPIVGLPMSDITKQLVEYGFTEQDLKDLEFLKKQEQYLDPAYHSNDVYTGYRNREVVIKYVQGWIADLQNQVHNLQSSTISKAEISKSVSSKSVTSTQPVSVNIY